MWNSSLASRLLTFIITIALPTLTAADWPQWRGPNGDGTVEAGNVPVKWSASENILWKTELPAWSGSTPIVAGDRVFVISPSEPEGAGKSNKRAGGVTGPGGDELFLYCLSLKDGSVQWKQAFDSGNALRMKHNATSPSPVVDDDRVYVVSGNGQVAAFTLDGRPVWTFDLEKQFGKIGTMFGYASSPLLVDGRLILSVIHGMRTEKPSYLLALDAATGKVEWREERPTDAKHESKDAYTTPTLLNHGGETQIVVLGANYVTGHDDETGKELWRGGGLNPKDARNFRIVPSPVAKAGMIFAPTRVQPLLAYHAGGEGDISESHLAWSYSSRKAPDVPTPVSDGSILYLLSDKGELTALDVETGEELWSENTRIGRVSASPILVGNKLYAVGERGETAVVQVQPEFNLLSRNELEGEYTLSTPVILDGRVIIRSGPVVYCIGN